MNWLDTLTECAGVADGCALGASTGFRPLGSGSTAGDVVRPFAVRFNRIGVINKE